MMRREWNKRSRLFGLLTVFVLLGSLLAACGETGNSGTTATAGAAATTTSALTTNAATTGAATTTSGAATTGAATTTTSAGGSVSTANLTAGVSKKFAGTTLNLIFANHPWATAIQKLIPQFEQASGMKLNIQNYFEDQLSQKLQIGLTSGSSGTDGFMFRPLQEGKLFDKNGWLQDLTSTLQGASDWNWSDFQDSARNTVTFENKVFGVPIVSEREIVYYRKDLFDQAGLQPPATLDELVSDAKKFTDPSKGMYGIVMRGKRNPAVTQFSSFLYSEGGNWQDSNGQPAVASPQAIAAYKLYGDLLRNYGPQGTLNMSWPEASAIFEQGKAAMWIDADSLYTNLLDPSKSTIVDKIGYAQFPAGPAGSKPYNVTSWAMGVNNASANKDAAWEFIKWASSAPVVMSLQQGGLPGGRSSVWNSPDGLKGFPPQYAQVAQSSSKAGVGADRPLVVKVNEVRDIVGGPLVAAIQNQDVSAAANTASKDFATLLQTDNK